MYSSKVLSDIVLRSDHQGQRGRSSAQSVPLVATRSNNKHVKLEAQHDESFDTRVQYDWWLISVQSNYKHVKLEAQHDESFDTRVQYDW